MGNAIFIMVDLHLNVLREPENGYTRVVAEKEVRWDVKREFMCLIMGMTIICWQRG
jgi:hypothetical protein